MTVGVAGIGRGVGTTHFTVLYANYLAGIRRMRTAVLERNQTGEFRNMELACTGAVREHKPYRVLDVDYYRECGEYEMAACMGRNYDAVLMDFGSSGAGPPREWLLCDRNILCLSFTEWQMNAGLEFLKEKRPGYQSWTYVAAFGSEETRREIKRKLGISVLRIPFSEDVFQITGRTVVFFEEL